MVPVRTLHNKQKIIVMKKAILIILTLMLGFNVKAQTSLTEAVDFYSIDDYGREVHLFDILDNGQFVFMYH
mgnify:CR=1 FL=1